MEHIEIQDAEENFLALLARVERGERIIIEKHGNPIARLVPAEQRSVRPHDQVVEELRAFRKGKRLNGLTIRRLIEEGRR